MEYAILRTPRSQRPGLMPPIAVTRSSPSFASELIQRIGPGMQLQPPPPAEAAPFPDAPELYFTDDPDEAQAARDRGDVVTDQPELPLRLIPQFESAGPAENGSPWGVQAVGADALPLGSQGEGACVAILDSGIDAGHSAFAGLIRDDNYRDFTMLGKADNIGHGTHCAGIIFGRPVDGTRIGVAPGIKNVFVGKIADTNYITTTKVLREALEWAVNAGANIISLSVGLDFLGRKAALEAQGYTDRVALAKALNEYLDFARVFDTKMESLSASAPGVNAALVFAACGNESLAADKARVPVSLPAAANKVISVTALGQADGGTLTVASFCNSLPKLGAPGVGILSAAPGGGLATMSGTSQAAPHAAGVAALWFQSLWREERVKPSVDDLRTSVLGSADRSSIAGERDHSVIGRGLIRAPKPAS